MYAPKGKEKQTYDHVKKRMEDMRHYREKTVERKWKAADEEYRLKAFGDDRFGKDYRTNKTRIAEDGWQSDNSSGIVFRKIQIALSILIDNNPTLKSLRPKSKVYAAAAPLMKALYDESVKREKLKYKLRRSVLDMSKYGLCFSQTFPRHETHPIKDLIEINPQTGAPVYKDDEAVDFSGVWYEPLNNWSVWWDENAKPYDMLSLDDWFKRITLTKDAAEKMFGKSKNWKNVLEKKSEDIYDTNRKNQEPGAVKRDDLLIGYVYESRSKDRLVVMLEDVMVLNVPLPTHKRLSLAYGIWNLGESDDLNCVGLAEILRQDKNMYDKIRNMSIDQLVLSIYKMFFYDGTLDADDTKITIRPGQGQSVLDPDKIKWLEVPTGGQEAYEREKLLENNMDADSGITPTLAGETESNKTAFEIEQAKNSAFRRLSTPLDGIKFMLELDAMNRIDSIKLIYSNVDVEEIANPEDVQKYLELMNTYPDMFKWDDSGAILYKYNYPELLLNLEEKDGVLYPSKEERFFLIKPEGVRWDGDVEIDIQPMLQKTPELERQQMLEFSNLVIPLLSGDPNINLKPLKKLSEVFEQDYKEWVPDMWLNGQPEVDRTMIPMMADKQSQPGATNPQGNPVSMAKQKNPSRIRTVVNKIGRMFTKINPGG